MSNENSYHTEKTVIEEAQNVLDRYRLSQSIPKHEFQQLLEHYKKLFRQTRRLGQSGERLQTERRQSGQRMPPTDQPIGVLNQYNFNDRLEREIQSAVQNDDPLSLIMVDIDHLKSINGQYGRLVGNKVIQWVTKLCQNSLRGSDVFGRLGGEEFAVILPGLCKHKAQMIAERLCRTIENGTLHENGEDIQVTISVGICHLADEITSLERMLSAADSALYVARRSGRNRVCCYSENTEPIEVQMAGTLG